MHVKRGCYPNKMKIGWKYTKRTLLLGIYKAIEDIFTQKYKTRTKNELREIYMDIQTVQEIKAMRIR